MIFVNAEHFGTVRDVQAKGGKKKAMKSKKESLIQNILLENYQSYYRLAFSYVHQEADAMDIVQEGAYKAMLKANTLRDEKLAGTWVYRIMINTAKNYLKKYKKKYEEYKSLEENYGNKEESSTDIELRDAVKRLSLQERTLIILRFYEDKSLFEIAEILQENLSTVKSRLYRTLEKLRRELS